MHVDDVICLSVDIISSLYMFMLSGYWISINVKYISIEVYMQSMLLLKIVVMLWLLRIDVMFATNTMWTVELPTKCAPAKWKLKGCCYCEVNFEGYLLRSSMISAHLHCALIRNEVPGPESHRSVDTWVCTPPISHLEWDFKLLCSLLPSGSVTLRGFFAAN